MKWLNKFFNSSNAYEQNTLSEESQRWNKFLSEICFRDVNNLSLIQKAAVLSFWYDAEMNSGGHSGYFDCYPKVSSEDLIWALCEVGGAAYVENFKKAISNGSHDGYLATDNIFYSIKPSLTDILMEFVEAHAIDLFTD